MNKFRVEFITPMFGRGAYEDIPEVRPASIRGQLHWWFRALGGIPSDENAIFGSVHTKPVLASKLVVRVTDLPERPNPPAFLPTLPHKPGGHDPRNAPNAPRCAFPAGSSFILIVGERLGGLSEAQRKATERTIKTWLLAGSLGLRTNRGGGAIHWSEAPQNVQSFRNELEKLLDKAPLEFDILSSTFSDAESARRTITETISHKAFSDLRYPLGAVRQGRQDPAPSRKTSPLRLTVRKFEDGYRILAVWDAREQITRNSLEDLRQAIARVANGTDESQSTEIGRLLQQSRFG